MTRKARQTTRKRKTARGKPKMPANFEEDTRTALKSTIECIFLKQPAPCDTEKLNQDVRDLCLFERGDNLYELIQEHCELHIAMGLELVIAQRHDTSMFLPLVEKFWMEFCDQMISICAITLHLDMLYVKQTATARSVWDLGLQLFQKHLLLSQVAEVQVVGGILKMIGNERLGHAIDRSILKNLLGMFSVLGTYTESFERTFLECTKVFYSREGAHYMQQLSIPDYLRHVEVRLTEEKNRCSHYLAECTRMPLVSVTLRQLLECNIPEILGKGFKTLMNAKCVNDLQRMYNLFSKIDALNLMGRELSSYTKIIGGDIVMDLENEVNLVASLIEMKLSLDGIWEACFLRNEAFARTIKEAFKYIVNLRQIKVAELISKFLDEKLCSGNKGASEEELEGVLSNVFYLFKGLEAKEIFKSFYKEHLSRRLLLRRSVSPDAEQSIILKFKTECGSGYTTSMETMLKDMQLSEEINDHFRLSSQARTRLPTGMEMSIDVLTSGCWPTSPLIDLRLPREITVCQDAFKEFYLSKFKGRRLSWLHSLGHCILQARFADGVKQLELSLLQTVLVMLFNDSPVLSFQDLRVASGIGNGELRRTLHSLACGKVCLLKKTSSGSMIEDEDTFTVNEEFNSLFFRVKLNSVGLGEMWEEKNTFERGWDAYRFQAEAIVIRIMKARKTLSHTDLVAHLLDQLNFNAQPTDLKRLIESLIAREFLKRDEGNAEMYKYLA